MGLERITKVLFTGLAAAVISTAVTVKDAAAAYIPTWEVPIVASYNGQDNKIANDTYHAGFGPPPATKGYDITADIRQSPSPPGQAIELASIVDGQKLTRDRRNVVDWDFALYAIDPTYQGLTGEVELSWDSSAIPVGQKLELVAYSDPAMTNELYRDNMSQTNSRSFFIDSALGPEVYFKIVPEPGTFTLGLLGALSLTYMNRGRKKAV